MIICKSCGNQKEWLAHCVSWKCRICEHQYFADTIKQEIHQALNNPPPANDDLSAWVESLAKVAATPTEPPFTKNFTEAIRTMQHAVHENAKAHGWWDNPPEDGTVIMMIVRELSELVEELRIGGRESAKIDGFSSMEEELADAVLRILDFAGRKGYRLGAAILAKHEYNLGREYKHGGKLF